jgi:hypothetical protein
MCLKCVLVPSVMMSATCGNTRYHAARCRYTIEHALLACNAIECEEIKWPLTFIRLRLHWWHPNLVLLCDLLVAISSPLAAESRYLYGAYGGVSE